LAVACIEGGAWQGLPLHAGGSRENIGLFLERIVKACCYRAF
jgi:hypothetical protein